METYCGYLEFNVLPQLGHLSLVDLRPRRLAEWQQERLAAGAGPAVLGKTQTLLSQILDAAVLPYEYLEVNPISALKKPAYERKPHRWLTAPEVEQIRGWFLDREDLASATLVSVLAYVGIRPQDTLALEWVDLTDRLAVVKKNVNGQIMAGAKTGLGYRRNVYVPPTVRRDLEDWRAASGGTHLIFPRQKDGKPWTRSDYNNWRSRRQTVRSSTGTARSKGKCFKAAAEAVGLGWNLKPYDLRHTGATLYAAAGWNYLEVARQLGHSPEVSMRVYQHLFDQAEGERRTVENYIREARGAVSEGANLGPTDGEQPIKREPDAADRAIS
ncbi:MAG: hypothetical protein QG596_1109 [Actinomycetota bacterium]|jgi:integrase|nr:hypothetical protein [Actinomycetota bacterium]